MDMKAAMNMIAEEEDDDVPGEPFFFFWVGQNGLYYIKIKTNVTV